MYLMTLCLLNCTIGMTASPEIMPETNADLNLSLKNNPQKNKAVVCKHQEKIK